MSRDSVGTGLVFFMLGAAVGASVALLYAPQDGESTRKYLGDKAEEVKDKAAEITTQTTDRAKEITATAASKAKEITSNVSQQAKMHVENLSNRAQELINRGEQATTKALEPLTDEAELDGVG